MTREEAIQCIKHELLITVNRKDLTGQAIGEALDMAIDALQDKTRGKWIVKQGNYCGVMIKEFYCDQCMTRGALRRVYSDPEPLPNFCSNCGADMRGGEE